MIFAGVEGGATHSKLILIKIINDGKIEKFFEEEGESLNCVIQGAEATCEYVSKWIQTASEKLGLDLPIKGVGLGLSGAGNNEIIRKIIELFNSKYSNIVKNCFVTNDAIAAIATAFKNGGVVLIAGTGSACRYLNNKGEIYGTGGNGHLIEESGGGFWIAQKAIQTIFNHEEGLSLSEHPINNLKTLIMEHFNLKEFRNILNILYGTNFSKANIASLSKKISENANKDPLCKFILEEAGKGLAQLLIAISQNFDSEIFEDVPILLVGSVFQSWNFMKDSFVKTIQINSLKIKKVSFFKLNESAALGAAILSAKNCNISYNFDFNTTEFIDSIILSKNE